MPFIILGNSQAIVINEFMPDPDDNCSDRSEWVEIFIDEPWDDGNITIDTGEGKMKINGTFVANEYLIITRNASIFASIWNLSDAKIIENSKMSLSNTADNITLYNNLVLIQKIEYSKPKNGTSYGFCNGELSVQNISTPGRENICAYESVNYTNETNSTGFCNVSLSIDSPAIFISGQKQNYYLLVEDGNCTEKDIVIEYWIENMFGGMVKSKYNTTQTVGCFKNISRDWTAEEIEGSEAYYINAVLASVNCNDIDSYDNHAEKIIVVKGIEPLQNSDIEITDVKVGSDGKAKFGDAVEVGLNAYRGDTTKSSIDIWIESPDGSKTAKTNFNIYTRFSNHTLSIPLQLNSNCNGDFADGTYLVKAEGIDSYDEEDIRIEGISTSLCKTKTIENSKPCSCPACQACKCENKSSVAVKNVINKTTEKINAPETGSASAKTNPTNIPENASALKNASTRNENKSMGKINMPTGEIISGNEENWFSSAVGGVINFFKNLFGL